MRGGVFGVAAAGQQCADLIAHMPAADAVTGLDHFAGDFEAENLGGAGRRRIEAGALGEVWPVHARRFDADEHFVVAGLRHIVGYEGKRLVRRMKDPAHR